jgi:hypothetical protein
VRGRLAGFAALCVALAVAGWVYLERAGSRPAPAPAGIRVVTGAEALARIRSGPHVVFRNTAQGSGYGHVALAALDAPGERFVTDLACDRVYAAGGRGVCLRARRGVVTRYEAQVLDAALAPVATLPLTGPPSRARVAPDGRLLAFTVFETGHSYAGADFSTRTTVVDAASAAPLADLESWPVLRDGAPFRDEDFNFWGVTFAPDGDRFYATLASGGRTFLVEGHLSEQEFRVLRDGVECPSLSPDGRRVAFKARRSAAGRLVWDLHVLELASGVETRLDGETRSVDDQAAWLDDAHLLYGMPEERAVATGGSDVWVMEARPGAAPRILLEQAWSPAVVR